MKIKKKGTTVKSKRRNDRSMKRKKAVTFSASNQTEKRGKGATLSEKSLRQLAVDLLTEHAAEDAWPLFRDQANRRYNSKVDGAHEAYVERAIRIFTEEGVDQVPIHGSLVETVAEDMAIYAGAVDETDFIAKAQHLIWTFEVYEDREASDSVEIMEWSARHLDKSGRFLVLKGKKT